MLLATGRRKKCTALSPHESNDGAQHYCWMDRKILRGTKEQKEAIRKPKRRFQ